MGIRRFVVLALPFIVGAMAATHWAEPSVAAPSFDCAKARSALDKLICADANLSRLDSDMALLYGIQRGQPIADREAIRRGQRDWAASRANLCEIPKSPEAGKARDAAVACLTRLYEARIGYLSLQFGDGSALDSEALDAGWRSALDSLKSVAASRTGQPATVANAERALQSGNAWMAEREYGALVANAPETWAHWYGLTRAALLPQGYHRYERASWIAYRAYQLARSTKQKQRSLVRVAQAVLSQGRVDAARGALALGDVFAAGQDVENGLGILAHRLAFAVESARGVAGSARPTICLTFNHDLPKRFAGDYQDYVQLSPAVQGTFRPSGRELCIDGVEFGQSYDVTVRAGLPSSKGFLLARTARNDVLVPHRDPTVAFRGDAYVLPKVGSRGLPLVTVNVDAVDLELYRINDRNLVNELNEARIRRALNRYEADQIAQTSGALLWKGSMETRGARNADITTAVPITEVMGERKPGVYVLLAENPEGDQRSWHPKATQWIVVSDLGMLTFVGQDGLTVAVRSLADTKPVAKARVALYARNNEKLDEQTTDSDGLVRFPAGLMRGEGGGRAAAVMVHGVDGDFSFIDLARPALDLSDRGAAGRGAPGSVDAFLYTERGIYRPGETVNLTTLLRDHRALSVPASVRQAPITLRLYRPDGTEHRRLVLAPAADVAGARIASLPFSGGAPTGRWTVAAHLDVDGVPLGQTDFLVEDFVPPKIEVSVTSESESILPDEAVEFAIEGLFLHGGAAAGLAGEAEVFLERDPEPFPAFARYRFGLAQDDWVTQRTALSVPDTDATGKSIARYRLGPVPETSLPLRARVRASLFEQGGRSVSRVTTLPVRAKALSLGLRAGFVGGRLDLGATAAFQVVALDREGGAVADQDLKWSLYREDRDYIWYNSDGRWKWRTLVTDQLVSSGSVRTDASGNANLESSQDSWGYYRVEVYDEVTRAAVSQRFQAGYSTAPVAGATPDKLTVSLDRDGYAVGDTAKVRIKGPFAGDVIVTVLGQGVRKIRQVPLPAEGTIVELPVVEGWGPGVYVAATALRPAGIAAQRGPGRAIGLTWMPVGHAARRLVTSLDAPEKVEPRTEMTVAVVARHQDGAPAREAWVTLAAVDDGVLQLTGYSAPDPAAHFLAKRGLAIDLRDLYGDIISARTGQPGTLSSGGDAAGLALNAGPSRRSSRVVSLFSGAVKLDDSGRASIPLEIPDFNGRLRLMAVAWSDMATGASEATTIVGDPLVTTVSLPRFLAPDDSARVSVSLDNRDAPAGTYSVAVRGVDAIQSGRDSLRDVSLDAGARKTLQFDLIGRRNGPGMVELFVAGPDGFSLKRRWDLVVRPAMSRETDRLVQAIPPGGALVTNSEIMTRFAPGDREVVLSVANGPNFDVPGLLKNLDLYPYGCLEQTTSRALPLLYLSSVAARVGAAPRDARQLEPRLEKAIRRIQEMQRRDGWFALWRPGGPRELWLSAYVMDFLARAREFGHRVDGFAFERGAIALRDWIRTARFDDDELSAAAYGAYVLARLEMIEAGDLRYLHDTQMGRMTSRLALAHLAAAHARYGDQARADAAFGAAFSKQDPGPNQARLRYATYGSALRDQAGLLVLGAEAGLSPDRLAWLETGLGGSWDGGRLYSTQEQAWMLLAAHVLMRRTEDLAVSIDGVSQPLENGILTVSLGEDRVSQGVRISNHGQEPATTVLSVSGYPNVSPKPSSSGYSISRMVYDLEGKPVAPERMNQRDTVVVVIEGRQAGAEGSGRHRTLVVDLLPAGLELENASFGSGRSAKQFGWMQPLTETMKEELRDDRYVAAIDLVAGQEFRLAYLARAVTPGRFAVPAVYVEDMYRPELFARGETGTIEIIPAP